MEDETFEHPERHANDHDSDTNEHESTDALLPVTLRQALAATQVHSGVAGVWNVDGRLVKKILVVATAIEENHKPETRTTYYKLIDGTNSKGMLAFRYVDGEFEPVIPLPLYEGVLMTPQHRYVRISGSLSAMRGGGTAIRVDGFHVVEDFHEVYVHKLQVLAVRLIQQRGPPPPEVLHNLSKSVEDPSSEERPTKVANESVPKQRSKSQSQPPQTPSPSSSKPTSSSGPNQPPTPSSQRRSEDVKEPPSKSPAHDPRSMASPNPPRSQTSPLRPARQNTPPPQPSTPSRSEKGKQREREARRFSMEDPLSGLTLLQRTILLKIMDGTNVDPEAGLSVVELAVSLKTEDGIEDADAITDALDTLLENGHISTDSEGVMYKAISQRSRDLYGPLS